MSVRKVSMRSTRARNTTTSTAELKEELLKWICERHATNGPLDRKLLRDRAMELATLFGVVGFKCSEAWLTLFLKKHGFSPGLTNCSGPIFEDYRVWIDLLRPLITRYRHRDLFNVDELVMYSDFLPSRRTTRLTVHNDIDRIDNRHDKSIVLPPTKCIGVLLCCNSSGTEKLEPLISHNNHMLDDTRNDKCHNRHDICSISDEKFADWLDHLNAKMSSSNRQILLLLSRERIRSLQNSRSPSHVKLVFFPKDFPAHLRPLRGDIFHSVKMTYRRRYVDHMRNRQGSSCSWSSRDIVESIFEAWNEVSQELIVSSFQRTKFREDESFLKIECPNWDSLETGMSFRKYVTFDDELSDIMSREIESRYMCNSNRYNLRKSRCHTVDIDDQRLFNVTREKPRKSRKKVETKIGKDRDGIRRDKRCSCEPGSSRMSGQYNSQGDCRNSRIHERSPIAKSPRCLPDHCMTKTIDDGARISDDYREIVDNAASKMIYENPEKRKIVMERCLRGTNQPINETSEESSGRSRHHDNTRDSHGQATKVNDLEGRSLMRKDKPENFPGDAGPSCGKDVYDTSETIGEAINSSRPIDFNDTDDAHVDGELRRKIVDVIETREDIERNDENSGTKMDDESLKRSRTVVDDDDHDDDEPTSKRSRTELDWAKRYEKTFVFGPESRYVDDNDADGKLRQSTGNDDRNNLSSPNSHRSTMGQSGSAEIEKRSIFTLDANSNNSPNVSYPKTKD